MYSLLFYWFDRILQGDTIMHLAIFATCALSGGFCYLVFSHTGAKRWPWWGKCLYYLALTFLLTVWVHVKIDQLQEWYVTPLGPPLNIHR